MDLLITEAAVTDTGADGGFQVPTLSWKAARMSGQTCPDGLCSHTAPVKNLSLKRPTPNELHISWKVIL